MHLQKEFYDLRKREESLKATDVSIWWSITFHLILLFPCSVFILSVLEDPGDGELPVLANDLFDGTSQEQKLSESPFLVWGQGLFYVVAPNFHHLFSRGKNKRGASPGEEEKRSGDEKNGINSSFIAKI